MSFNAERVVLLGLGLISGSLAKALRRGGWSGELVAWGPREKSLALGAELGVVDRYSLDLEEAISGADMIVVGAPPVATGELLAQLLPRLAAQVHAPVVTDLASIKGFVIAAAATSYPGFVPGHPIAGSEDSGVAAARANLFAGRETILTPLAETSQHALEQVHAMWLLAGSRVTLMSVQEHDAALAASSHSPHMLAYALTMALAKDPLMPMQHGGGALRDMTRIAASDPVMWRDVALTNSEALLKAISQVTDELALLSRLVEQADSPALTDYFARCRQVRRDHDAVLNPLFESANKETEQP
jgi:prephenate dehydrogenase